MTRSHFLQLKGISFFQAESKCEQILISVAYQQKSTLYSVEKLMRAIIQGDTFILSSSKGLTLESHICLQEIHAATPSDLIKKKEPLDLRFLATSF